MTRSTGFRQDHDLHGRCLRHHAAGPDHNDVPSDTRYSNSGIGSIPWRIARMVLFYNNGFPYNPAVPYAPAWPEYFDHPVPGLNSDSSVSGSSHAISKNQEQPVKKDANKTSLWWPQSLRDIANNVAAFNDATVRTLFGWNPRWEDVFENDEGNSEGEEHKLIMNIMNPSSPRPWDYAKLVGVRVPGRRGGKAIVDLEAGGFGVRVVKNENKKENKSGNNSMEDTNSRKNKSDDSRHPAVNTNEMDTEVVIVV